MYSTEQVTISFLIGLLVGVVSTLLVGRKGLTLETVIALLIMSLWLAMHLHAFFVSGREVDWVFNIVGFGAVGTFIGVNIRHLSLQEVINLIKKK